jgi:hypothetical protein
MDVATISLKRTAALASVLAAAAVILVVLPARQASAAHGDCTMTVSGPFFYADMVFPVIEVNCESVKRAIRIDASLDRDGTEVATSSRTCRRTDHCVTGLASDGIFAMDEPGDQRWCGHGTAGIRSQGRTHVIPEATSCESESF